jgi:hypothetical protein
VQLAEFEKYYYQKVVSQTQPGKTVPNITGAI